MPLKIAMVAACPFPAAFASSGLIRELSLALSRRGHEIHVVTYHLSVPGFDSASLNIHRIPQVSLYQKLSSGISKGKPFLDFLLSIKLLQVIRKHQIDIIHAHNYEAPIAGFIARKLTGKPVIYHAHNTMFHELPTYFTWKYMQRIAQFAGKKLDDFVPVRSDHVIAISQEQYRYLVEQGIPEDRISLVSPGIDAGSFFQGDGTEIRNRIGITSEPLLIYTGGLQAYQNCLALVNVLQHILPQRPNTHLLIVARSAPEYLKSYAMEKGVIDRIHFIQGVSLEMERDCLAAADVAVVPRVSCIGFPIKLLNYLSASKPVVCFDSMVKEFKSGQDLLAVPMGDEKAMAVAILQLLNDKQMADQLGRQGYLTVSTRFDWGDIASEIEKIYFRTLDRQ